MESEPTEHSAYLPATSPEWIAYYKRAKATRRLGKGEHNRIQSESKRRRRQANLIALASTALLAAIVAICAALLDGTAPADGEHSRFAPSLTADARRG